jgi:hypothetical protein
MPRSAARTCSELVGAPHRLVGDEMGVADGIGRGTRLARPRRVGGSEIAPRPQNDPQILALAWPPPWLAQQDVPCLEGDARRGCRVVGMRRSQDWDKLPLRRWFERLPEIHCHSRPKGFRHADISRVAIAPPSPVAAAGRCRNKDRASPAARRTKPRASGECAGAGLELCINCIASEF